MSFLFQTSLGSIGPFRNKHDGLLVSEEQTKLVALSAVEVQFVYL
jgi:hypothetical protein